MRNIIYLDFDGVLNPWLANNPQKHWADYRKQQVNVQLAGDNFPTQDVKVWYSLELGKALRDLMDKGIEIVWASTWCANNQANKVLAPLFNLPDLRTLPFNPWGDREFGECGKLPVVAHDAEQEPTKFIWIDDDLGRIDYAFIDRCLRANPDIPMAHGIKPLPQVGLTKADIEYISTFFGV